MSRRMVRIRSRREPRPTNPFLPEEWPWVSRHRETRRVYCLRWSATSNFGIRAGRRCDCAVRKKELRPDPVGAQQEYRAPLSVIAEDVGGAGFVGGIIGLIAADAFGGAVFATRADHQGLAVAAQGHGAAKFVVGLGVGALDVGLLGPGVAAASEEVQG